MPHSSPSTTPITSYLARLCSTPSWHHRTHMAPALHFTTAWPCPYYTFGHCLPHTASCLTCLQPAIPFLWLHMAPFSTLYLAGCWAKPPWPHCVLQKTPTLPTPTSGTGFSILPPIPHLPALCLFSTLPHHAPTPTRTHTPTHTHTTYAPAIHNAGAPSPPTGALRSAALHRTTATTAAVAWTWALSCPSTLLLSYIMLPRAGKPPTATASHRLFSTGQRRCYMVGRSWTCHCLRATACVKTDAGMTGFLRYVAVAGDAMLQAPRYRLYHPTLHYCPRRALPTMACLAFTRV